MQIVIELSAELDCPVKLEQRANGSFRITYGQQVSDNLPYARAAEEFGNCVFHSLACAGKLDNTKE